MDAEEIAQQQALLETYRRTLAVYIQQQATIGRAYSPPALINGIAETRSEIKRIKALLQAANVPVSSDPDDDEPPPPIIVVQRADQRWIWLGGAAGLLGLVLLLVLVMRNITAIPSIPSSTALSQATQRATPSASSTEANTLLFSDDFSHGRIDTWSGNSDEWSLVQDAAQTLYQGQVVSDSSADSNPVSFYNELDDYALEIRIRISNIGADDDIPDFWFTLRANSPPANGCEGYAFNYYGVSQTAIISRLGSEPCPY